ncbi:diaminopimelate decarboxylase [Tenacibaculum gallaicum]|uniref:Diaminopimelate decarboxylase n=1 Tax=Tenacibaculum gallaicum TaxID=561505 RepID=A0A3E0HMQ8_9FLAO|nr:diaminopimelate decarboxylase [Tenacibaculum gallaicum]REH47506.1 diaminopimelate decarboxylase [Tenacibaculum gallaicum]
MNRQDLLKLTDKYQSPLYVYDTEKIISQYKKITTAFSKIKNVKINYAVKALSNINILKVFNKLNSGLDTVSIQEVKLGLLAGFEPHEIIYTPNGVSLQEIEEVAKLGVQINIDNLSILELFGQKHPKIPVCIRINPHVMAGGNSKISVGHIDSKFGISIHQVPHIKRVVENTGMHINGMHMHTGSDILDIDTFIRATEILFDTARQFKDIDFIDFGSGFKVPYKKDDISTDINELGKKLSTRFNEFCKNYGREVTLMFEPGKFLVSEAGYFLAKVNVIKQTTSTVFAGIDSGLNHLIRPMFYNSYHYIENLSNPKGRERFYSIVGYICENDTFGSNRRISEISEDDILCFHNSGAYCFSMASNYNSRYKPAEVMIYKGKDYLIRKRETMEDLLKNQESITL